MLKTFIPVDLETLVPETMVGFDLYIERESSFLLYSHKDLPFASENRKRLMEQGFEKVYIQTGDQDKYAIYMEEHISHILANPDISLPQKTKIVYDTSTALMQSLFADPRSTDKIQRSKKIISHTVDLVLSGKEATRHLMSLTAHDYYTYTHSVNVSIFGLALMERLFGQPQDIDYYSLGQGFLLHDLGKSLIDLSIINKRTKLNDEEWEIMKRHPEMGCRLMEEAGELPAEVRAIILEHHEQYQGGGYPHHKKGDEITPYGRICCIADVFDAISTKRTYREAYSSYKTLELMQQQMKDHFDPEYFLEFILLFNINEWDK